MRRSRLWLMLICLLVAALAAPAAGAAEAELKVQINGQILTLDTPPFIDNGRTLVPLRAIFEALGAQIGWNGATRTVTGTRAAKKVVLTVDSDQAQVDGQAVKLAVAARIRDGRTFVPLRFVAEALGATVDYDPETRTVIVVDLNYAGAGEHTPLLQKMAAYRAQPDADFQARLVAGQVAEGAAPMMDATVAGQVRGSDAYFKMTQAIAYMGYKINQTSELAVRGGQVYHKRAGDTAWKALGQGTARLDKMDIPGGLDPSRLFNTPLTGAIQSAAAGATATVGGEAYQEFTLTFDPARLQVFFDALAKGFGKDLLGVSWDTLQARVQVRTADGFARKTDLLFTWTITEADGTTAKWQLTTANEWLPAAGPITWPADLPQ